MTTRLPHWAAALLLVLPAASAGCGLGRAATGHPAPAASASAAAASAARYLAIGRRFAQCVRAHGIPGFPDPVLNDGYLELPAGSGPQGKAGLRANKAAQNACQPILAELPPTATRKRGPQKTLSMQNLLRFAQCVRQHGIPRWPDPDANGDFPLSAAGIAGKSPAVAAAMQSCRQYADGSIGVK
ncbi:MAG: hypothetical protein V7603_6806 [Micromonosporaceae bacterium]